jgi:hypothetical protein|eukprot:COSAG01_NODE_6699_length_3538_cov_14.488805_1_plen_66_part_00
MVVMFTASAAVRWTHFASSIESKWIHVRLTSELALDSTIILRMWTASCKPWAVGCKSGSSQQRNE